MTSPQSASVVTTLLQARDLLADLETQGWDVRDGIGLLSLQSPRRDEPHVLLSTLDALQNFAQDCRLVGSRGGTTIGLRRRRGALILFERPDGSPSDLFDEVADQRAAEDVLNGDTDSALALPFEWRAEAEIDLSRLVDGHSSEVKVSRYIETVEDVFARTSIWELGRLVPPETRRFYVALDAPRSQVDFETISLAGPETDLKLPVKSLSPAIVEQPLEMPNLANPSNLTPLPSLAAGATIQPWSNLLRQLRRAAAASALCFLASEARLIGNVPQLTFRGLRRTTVTLDTSKVDVDATLKLFDWTFVEPSPDRLLAVQQVASLQDSCSLLEAVHDIRDSAEIVYLGLRSDAVAEAVKGYRDAHTHALDAARQSVKSVQEMVKSSVERGLASLVAVGAVLIARASLKIDGSTAESLLCSVAAFLVFLAAVSLLVESPLASVPLKNLSTELRRGSPLISEGQADVLAGGQMVEDARSRARIARIFIPASYITGAILLVSVAIPLLPAG